MFECQSCLQRGLQALLSLQLSFSPHASWGGARRKFHDTLIRQQELQRKTTFKRPDSSRQHRQPLSRKYDVDSPIFASHAEKIYKRSKQTSGSKELSRAQPLPLAPEDSEADAAEGVEPPNALSNVQKRRLRIELQYLKDPKKLAEHVQYCLRRKDEAKALALVRLSSLKASNTVSWNHVIDHQMTRGQTNTALDTFNEMKKRGQRPDSYTYMLLLRGLSQNVDSKHPTSLNKALSVYHSMSAKGVNASVSIMHTNAMLKVCSRAMDLGSMWDIVSKLPEKGPHAANSWTFTTMLNTMAKYASSLVATGSTKAEQSPVISKHVEDGKQLWSLVTRRWREGDLVMDEELVCAMGRLLLISPDKSDQKLILRLVQQTMGVPNNLVSDPGDGPITNDKDNVFAPSVTSSYNAQDKYKPQRHASYRSAAYAIPSHNTLSLLLSACTSLRATDAGNSYWTALTSTDIAVTTSQTRSSLKRAPVTPDMDNIHAYLRLLLVSHNSKLVSHLITQSLPEWNLTPQRKTFRIAMSACARDTHTNIAAGMHATAVLDAMDAAPSDAQDVLSRAKYIELYTRVKPSSQIHEGNGIMPSSTVWTTMAILRNETAIRSAINGLFPSSTSASSKEKPEMFTDESERALARDAAQLAQAVVSAHTAMARAKSGVRKPASEPAVQQGSSHNADTQARPTALPASIPSVENLQRVKQLFRDCVNFLKNLEIVDSSVSTKVRTS